MAKANDKQSAPAETSAPRANRKSTASGEWANVKPLPPPLIPDGFFVFEEGAVIEGTILGTGEGKYGEYLIIRTKNPITCSQGQEYVEVRAGGSVAVSDRAALRPLFEAMRQGPTACRVEVLGKSGKAWDLDVRHRPAF